MFSDSVSKVMSKNYGQGWSAEELQKLRKDVCAFKYKFVNPFLSICTFGLRALKYHLLDHLIEGPLSFGGIFSLNASPFEHFNTSIKASYRNTSKLHAPRKGETKFGLDQMQTSAARKMLAEKWFLQAFLVKKHYA